MIDYLVHLGRVSASASRVFDEAAFRQIAGRVFDRTDNIASSMKNHNVMDGDEPWRERLGELHPPAS